MILLRSVKLTVFVITQPIRVRTPIPADSWTAILPAITTPKISARLQCDDSDCPTFDYYCADCANDAACLDDLYCNGVETCTKDGCVAGVSPCAAGLLCEESTDSCLAVDCLASTDCMFFENCDAQNECIEKEPTCGLKINPKQMQANKLFAAEGFTFKIQGIKGQTGFDPNAPKYFGEQIDEIQSVVKKGKLKTQVKGDTANPINPGTLEIWVGNCAGTVVLK